MGKMGRTDKDMKPNLDMLTESDPKKLTNKEYKYLYNLLNLQLHNLVERSKDKKGISRKNDQIYISALWKVHRMIEDLPFDRKFLFMKVDR